MNPRKGASMAVAKAHASLHLQTGIHRSSVDRFVWASPVVSGFRETSGQFTNLT